MSGTQQRTEEAPEAAQAIRFGHWVFESKAALLRVRRTAVNMAEPPKRHRRADHLAGSRVLAVIRSPLWTSTGGAKARALNAGKVRNLELATGGFDGVEVGAGQVLSFWRQVGRPSRRRGFLPGRELREGCVIASVGGGLCQLSNALYEAALEAGLEIVERHAHTRTLPGSRSEVGRDATVFWNYVDLRVRAPAPVRIEARLTAQDLELVLRGDTPATPRGGPGASPPAAAHDCLTCGRASCHRHDPDGQ